MATKEQQNIDKPIIVIVSRINFDSKASQQQPNSQLNVSRSLCYSINIASLETWNIFSYIKLS